MTDIYTTSPSSTSDDYRCARIPYWKKVVGIEPNYEDLDLALGKWLHAASAEAVQGNDVTALAVEAAAHLQELVLKNPPPSMTPEEVALMVREWGSLTEGLIWAINFRVVPRLLEEYEIVAVEKERWIELVPSLVRFRATPDLILRSKFGHSFSFSLCHSRCAPTIVGATSPPQRGQMYTFTPPQVCGPGVSSFMTRQVEG